MIKIIKTISPIEIKVSFDSEDRPAFIAGQSVPNVCGWMTESVSPDVNEAILVRCKSEQVPTYLGKG